MPSGARGSRCVIVDSDLASRSPAFPAAVAFTRCMREHCAAESGPAPWPGVPHEGSAPARGQARSYPAVVGEITSAVDRTQGLFLMSGGLLAGDAAGTVAVAVGLLGHRGALAVGTAGLLIPVTLGWLVSAALLLWAQRSVDDALGELRWVTGAPVDLSIRRPFVSVLPSLTPEAEWPHVVRLIGAVAVRQGRARLALSAAILTTAGFLAWTVVSLTIAAMI
jgi:hypothetical protein